MFKPATKAQAKLRLALIGPAGAGKTYTALAIASTLGKRVAVLDTERGSASKYADLFTFDTVTPETFAPHVYQDVIKAAEAAGYDVLIIDSLSHAWSGKGGALEMVDDASKRQRSGNTFSAWRDVTPAHNGMVDSIVSARLHIIATMRSKMEYVQEKDANGKTVVRKVGLQPVQRDGLEYEFDVVADLTTDNDMIIGKTRCSALKDRIFHQAGADVAAILNEWLSSGVSPNVEATRRLKALWGMAKEICGLVMTVPPLWSGKQPADIPLVEIEQEISRVRTTLLTRIDTYVSDVEDAMQIGGCSEEDAQFAETWRNLDTSSISNTTLAEWGAWAVDASARYQQVP